MRNIEASEIKNWSFEGLPGTSYYLVDEPDDSTRLLLSVLTVAGSPQTPSYVFILKVSGIWHLSPWLNDKMVDVLLRVAPPSIAMKRITHEGRDPEPEVPAE